MAEAITNEFFAFNVVGILHIINGPPEETLKTVLEYLRLRHPLLGVHIEKHKGRFAFVSEGTPGIPLTVVERRDGDHWLEVAEDELNRKFDMFTGPLVRVTYLKDSDGKTESEIIVTIQHSVADAVSGANLLHEILVLCETVESRGSLDALEGFDPFSPLPPVEAFFPPAYKGFRRKWKIFSFMLRQMGDEFLFQMRSMGKRKPPIHPAGRCKILPVKLSKELTGALSRSSRKRRVTLNNLLTAALSMVVHKHLYGGRALPLRYISTADLRPYLVPPLDGRYFGSYFSMLRITVGMKENMGIWELTRRLNDLTYASLKRGDKYCANLLSYRMMRMLFRFKAFRMCAGALSFTGPVMMRKRYGKIEVRDLHAFPSNFVLGPEYSAAVRMFDDQIYWDILYLDSDMDREQAEVMAGEIRTILESVAEEDM